jgi:hypothetical protein
MFIRCETCRDEGEVHLPRLFLTLGLDLTLLETLDLVTAFAFVLGLALGLALTTFDLELTAGDNQLIKARRDR